MDWSLRPKQDNTHVGECSDGLHAKLEDTWKWMQLHQDIVLGHFDIGFSKCVRGCLVFCLKLQPVVEVANILVRVYHDGQIFVAAVTRELQASLLFLDVQVGGDAFPESEWGFSTGDRYAVAHHPT